MRFLVIIGIFALQVAISMFVSSGYVKNHTGTYVKFLLSFVVPMILFEVFNFVYIRFKLKF
jgi:hypothetical protein